MWKRIAASLLLAGALFVWILRRVELDHVGAVLAHARWPLLPFVLLLLGTSIFIKAQRWALAIAAESGERPSRRTFSAMMIGVAANLVFPARLGDWLRVIVLRKHNRISIAHALVAGWGVQAFDLLAVAAILIAGVAAGIGIAPLRTLITLLVAVVGIIGVLGFVGRHPRVLESAARRLPFGLGSRAATLAHRASAGLRFLGAPSFLAGVVCYTLAIWVVEVAAMWLALEAFQIATSVAAAGLLVAAIGLAFVIPLTPGNVGTYQVISILVLGIFGVDADRAFAFGIGYQGFALVATTAVGMALLQREGFSWAISEVGAVADADGRRLEDGAGTPR